MSESPIFGFHDRATPIEASAGVVRRTLVSGERMLFVEFTLAQGTGVPPHSHPHEQVGYVVSGRMELTIGNDARVLGPGDGYLIPGDVVHFTHALEPSVVIDVFSPIREDYLVPPVAPGER